MNMIIDNTTFDEMFNAYSNRTGIKIPSVVAKMILLKYTYYPKVSMKNFIKIIKKENMIKV